MPKVTKLANGITITEGEDNERWDAMLQEATCHAAEEFAKYSNKLDSDELCDLNDTLESFFNTIITNRLRAEDEEQEDEDSDEGKLCGGCGTGIIVNNRCNKCGEKPGQPEPK